MTSLTELWKNLTKYFSSTEVPLKSAIIGLVVYGVKEFFKRITFSCPEVGYEAYGHLYIIAPAVILFCLSLLASDSFWTAMTCCCQKLAGRKLRLTWWKARKAIYLASLLPLSWLVIAFVDTKFYVCACLGPEDAKMAKANTTAAKAAVKRDFQTAASDSQKIGWYIMLGLVLFATVVISIMRLWKKLDPVLISKDDVDKDEADMVVKLFQEQMKPLLAEKAQGIVSNLLPTMTKGVDKEDVSAVIKKGIEVLTKMYPSHGGVLRGLYKDTDEANGENKKKSKDCTDGTKKGDETEMEVLVES